MENKTFLGGKLWFSLSTDPKGPENTRIYEIKALWKIAVTDGTRYNFGANRPIVPKWDWHNCPQVRLAQLFPWETGTIVFKWDWRNCSQVRLTQLFPSETDTIVFKWDWHNCFQVRLTQLFPSETGKIVPKWD